MFVYVLFEGFHIQEDVVVGLVECLYPQSASRRTVFCLKYLSGCSSDAFVLVCVRIVLVRCQMLALRLFHRLHFSFFGANVLLGWPVPALSMYDYLTELGEGTRKVLWLCFISSLH